MSIPADEDGYVEQQCPLCHQKFRATVTIVEEESSTKRWCPYCGLQSESFFTDDFIEYAQQRALDEFLMSLHKEMKSLERKTRGKTIEIKAGKAPKAEAPSRIIGKADDLMEIVCPRCSTEEKVQGIAAISGCYCTKCGEMISID